MHRKFPKQIIFDEDEVWRINRIRIAKWLGVKPDEIDRMPASDVEDIMEIMWADDQK